MPYFYINESRISWKNYFSLKNVLMYEIRDKFNKIRQESCTNSPSLGPKQETNDQGSGLLRTNHGFAKHKERSPFQKSKRDLAVTTLA